MINEYKVDKIAGFIYRALEYSYSYDEAWNILLTSSSGKNILNDIYSYIYHIQGPTSFCQAVDVGDRQLQTPNVSIEEVELLAEFIEFAHEHNIEYQRMFTNESLGSFMKNCGSVLGNYDEKLLVRIA